MDIQVKPGDRLFNYKVLAVIKSNSVYQWVRAIGPNNQSFVLQLLVTKIDSDLCKSIIEYFDALHSIQKPGLWIPIEILCNHQYPLVAVYTDLPTKPLNLDLQQAADTSAFNQTVEQLYEASEALFALHNKQLVHGCVTPESFVLVNDKVHLTNFGYKPLLNAKHPETLNALTQESNFLAPETARESLEITSDAYAFAKIATHWQPQLIQTQWYDQATQLIPSNRFRRMRELFNALKQALANLSGSTPPEPSVSQNSDLSAAEPSSSTLVPKYQLQGQVEPAHGGSIEGVGQYRSGTQVTLRAVPIAGWRFVQWSGDIAASENPIALTVNGHKAVTAEFQKVPVTVTATPPATPRKPPQRADNKVKWAENNETAAESPSIEAEQSESSRKKVKWAETEEQSGAIEEPDASPPDAPNPRTPNWAKPN
jgi:hypothetical protein